MTDTVLFRQHLQTAAEVAQAGYHALSRGRRRVVVGLGNKLTVLSTRLAPRTAVARVSRRLLSRKESAPVEPPSRPS